MKPRALPLLFVLLSAISLFGRTGSDEDAQAIKGVLRLREGLRDPDSLQVSRVVATNRGVCIEYRGRGNSGGMSTSFAVYKTDKDLVYVDNSWVWDQACLVGKYGQRREGRDATEVVSAALKGKQAPALSMQPESSAAPTAVVAVATRQIRRPAEPARVETIVLTGQPTAVPTAPRPVALVQAAHAVHPPGSVEKAAAITREPETVVAPALVVIAPSVRLPDSPARVDTVVLTAKTPVATTAPSTVGAVSAATTPATAVAPQPTAAAEVAVEVAPTTVQPAPVAQPTPATPAAQAPAPPTLSYAVSSAPVASVQLGTIRGVTIVDNQGALEKKGPPPAPESLGDAARRLRHSKQP
jgi:hypothetical protein